MGRRIGTAFSGVAGPIPPPVRGLLSEIAERFGGFDDDAADAGGDLQG